MNMKIAIGAALSGAALLALVPSSPSVVQEGYFKSEGRDRVFAYRVAAPVDEMAARKILSGVASTEGRVTQAYLYEGDAPSPGHALTGAPDLVAAIVLIADTAPGWSYRMRRNPGGVVTFDAQAAHP